MNELGRMSSEEFKSAQKKPIIIVLDNVRSLNNVGSAFRTADAFLIEAIFLCGLTGIPPNKEIEKTALGATETVNWKYYKTTLEAIAELKNKNYFLVAVEQTKQAVMLDKFENPKKETAFVFGNEVYGVEQNIIDECDVCIEIPQFGSKHSLNISVCVGIVLWEAIKEQSN